MPVSLVPRFPSDLEQDAFPVKYRKAGGGMLHVLHGVLFHVTMEI